MQKFNIKTIGITLVLLFLAIQTSFSQLEMNSAGNIGIGSTPSDEGWIPLKITSPQDWASSCGIGLVNGSTQKWEWEIQNHVENRFLIYDKTSTAERFTIYPNGPTRINGDLEVNGKLNGNIEIDEKVGIGTSPSNYDWIQLKIKSDESSAGISLENQNNYKWEVQNGNSNQFFIHDRTADIERFVIDQAGKTGIGTANPETKLHIEGGNGVSNGIKLSGSYRDFFIYKYGTSSNESNDKVYFNRNGSTIQGMSIDGWGRVQFKSSCTYPTATSVSSVVDYSSQKSFATFYDGEQTFYVLGDGRVWSNGDYLVSDSTEKKDIKKIEKSVEKLQQIKGVTFNWKEDKKDFLSTDSLQTDSLKNQKKKQLKYQGIGVLAQEVEQVFPEAVMTDENGKKAVCYSYLIAPLIEAVKEQQTVIETQERQFATAQKINEEEISTLKAENKQLIKTTEKLQKENEQINERLTLLENQLDLCCKENNSNSGNNGGKKEKTGIDDLEVAILYQNTPNPFTESTEIDYYLPETVNTAIIYVYDLQGIQKASFPLNERGNAGLQISGSSLVAGMYIYSLIADGKEIDTKRMILTK